MPPPSLTDSLSQSDWFALINLWLPRKSYMYANFEISDFVLYVNQCIAQGRCHVGRTDNIPDALYIWAPDPEFPDTCYFETFIGNTGDIRRFLREQIKPQYPYFSKHRNDRYKRIKL